MPTRSYRRPGRARRLLFESLCQRLALAAAAEVELLDFGDAPLATQSGLARSYPTLAVDDGAAHVAVGPQLGAARRPTPDAQPDAFAAITTGYVDVNPVNLGSGSPTAIQAADFNQDGLPDVATVRAAAGDLVVLPGKTGSGFDSPQHVSLDGCLKVTDFQVADVNGDGLADVVSTCGTTNEVVVLSRCRKRRLRHPAANTNRSWRRHQPAERGRLPPER